MSAAPRDGLCPGCVHVRVVTSDRGSVFLRCGMAKTDPRFQKYPPQPVVRCEAHPPGASPERSK